MMKNLSLLTASLLLSSEPSAKAYGFTPSPRSVRSTSLHVSNPLSESDLPFFIAQPPSENGLQHLDKESQDLEGWIYHMNKILIDTVYEGITFMYPTTGSERDYVRFYVLETVARVPYFAYLSVMHLQETLGLRYDTMSDRMWMHYAEADNELHHLLIMEELLSTTTGEDGAVTNKSALYWWDKALAQAMALLYFWYVVIAFIGNQPAAYHLSELIEDHAYNTYDNFLKVNHEKLKELPVPAVARQYYEHHRPMLLGDDACVVPLDDDTSTDLMMSSDKHLNSLYDVFVNIRNDEKDHWETLCNLVQFNEMHVVEAGEVKSTQPKQSSV